MSVINHKNQKNIALSEKIETQLQKIDNLARLYRYKHGNQECKLETKPFNQSAQHIEFIYAEWGNSVLE